jgi:hypothetical protein
MWSMARLMLPHGCTTDACQGRGGSFAVHVITVSDAQATPAANVVEGNMKAESRRKIEMGARALEFSHAHPDSEPGAAEAVARLEQLVMRANETAAVQRDGIIRVRAASTRKQELRREMLDVPIAHLAEVGRAAARDEHELGKTFQFNPSASTFLAFRTAARSMIAAAQAHREVLLKHGLSQSVLDEFVRKLDEFDAVMALGNDGRTNRMGATRELQAVALEIVRMVRVMDGRNRQRFADDAQLMGSWISASRVLGKASRTGTDVVVPVASKPAEGEVRPAA